MTNRLPIHIFELPKVLKELISGDDKQKWMELIKANSEEVLEMAGTTAQDPEIQKGSNAVYALDADTVLREQIRQRNKAIRDYDNEMAIAWSEGKEEGRAEGMAEARAEGREEGMFKVLVELVNDGIITLAQAAEQAHITVSEFEAKTGLKV